MKKVLLIITIICFGTKTYASRDTVIINNTTFLFEIKQVNNQEEGIGNTILKLFRIEDREKKYLLSHTLFDNNADCNSEAMELGAYTIQDSTLIFYTHWSKGGDAPGYPCGVRKQIYIVGTNGKLTHEKTVAYIEYGSMQTDIEPFNGEMLPKSGSEDLKKEIHAFFKDALKQFTDDWIKRNEGFGFCVF